MKISTTKISIMQAGLAALLALLLVVNTLVNLNPLKVTAIEPTISVDFNDGSVSGNDVTFNINNKNVTASLSSEITGTVANLTASDIISISENFDPETMEIVVYVPGGFKTTLAVSEGKTSLSNRTTEGGYPDSIKFNIQAKSSGGQELPPPPAGEGKELTVIVDAPEGLSHGIRFDGRNVEAGKALVAKDSETCNIEIGVEFGKALSKVEINGTTYTEIPAENEGWVMFMDIPVADTFTIKLYEGESDDITMLWVYNQQSADEMNFGDDAVVENGKVELISIKRNGEYLDIPEEAVDDESGYVMLKKGDDVTVKLIPNYGYQLKSVSVNGQDLTPMESVSTFELQNIQNNIHFSGAFVKSEDQVKSTSEIAKTPAIADGGNAATSGNLSLSVADNSTYSKDVTTAIKDNSNVQKIASLDVTLDNIVSKGNGDNWTTNITEFENPITILMNVPIDTLSDGETFGVIRDHNGVLEEIEATYSDGVLSFKTNRFSTYTLVKKSTVATPDTGKKDDNTNNEGKEEIKGEIKIDTETKIEAKDEAKTEVNVETKTEANAETSVGNPATGDSNIIYLFAVIMTISIASMILAFRSSRKTN